jgi:hypothetical protein
MGVTDSEALAPAGAMAASRRSRSKLYVILSVLMLLMVIVGFWPSYYGPLVSGTANVALVLHFHGIVFFGWMILFIAQAALAASGNIRAHRSLGSFGIWYGSVILVFGTIVSFLAPMIRLNAGEWTIDEAAAFLPIPLIDMILFGGFFIAGVRYRPQPLLHKRLMFLATAAILFAAAFRMQAAGMMPLPAAVLLWYVPVVIGMIHDFRVLGKVHNVYWIGLVAMTLSLVRLPLGGMEWWPDIGRPIFETLTG